MKTSINAPNKKIYNKIGNKANQIRAFLVFTSVTVVTPVKLIYIE